MVVRRVFGVLLILTGLLGLGLGCATGIMGLRVARDIEITVNDMMTTAVDGLETTRDMFVQVEEVVGEVQTALIVAQQTVSDIGVAMEESAPMVDQVSSIISEDVPNSLDSVQEAIPNIAQVAQTLDQTLRTLSALKWQNDLLGIKFDLGIEYDPEVPLDEPITTFGENLSDLPQQFRDLGPDLDTRGRDLEVIGAEMREASTTLTAIGDEMAGLDAIAQQYVMETDRISAALAESQAALSAKFKAIRLGIILLSVWLSLFQIVPFYLGWELVAGRRGDL